MVVCGFVRGKISRAIRLEARFVSVQSDILANSWCGSGSVCVRSIALAKPVISFVHIKFSFSESVLIK